MTSEMRAAAPFPAEPLWLRTGPTGSSQRTASPDVQCELPLPPADKGDCVNSRARGSGSTAQH